MSESSSTSEFSLSDDDDDDDDDEHDGSSAALLVSWTDGGGWIRLFMLANWRESELGTRSSAGSSIGEKVKTGFRQRGVMMESLT